MSEIKRGYPNPNYTEKDMIGLKELPELPELPELHADIMIDDDDYRELVSKAAALDILAAHIKATGSINDDVVYAVTGLTGIQNDGETKKYADWWHEECRENEKLKARIAELELQIHEMQKDREEVAEG